MYRRLYFVLPDEFHALQVMRQMEAHGVNRDRIHAIPGHGTTLGQLPPASLRQQQDIAGRIEKILWMTNMVIFFLALIGLIQALASQSIIGSVVAILVVGATLGGGVLFAARVPDTHLGELRGALSHDDIVLMVDVPKTRVHEIGEIVERNHPEVTAGGVGWAVSALGI